MAGTAEAELICQLESTKPTVENVTPYSSYQQTQPRLKGFSLYQQNELPVLYGGGREFLLSLIPGSDEPADMNQAEVVDFFILNTCMVIWINTLDRGLRIPYQKVVYHGVHPIESPTASVEGHTLEIVLTVQRDVTLNQLFPTGAPTHSADPLCEFTMSTVELILRPKYADFDRHYNDQMENLFTFKEFGLNRGDTLVVNCSKAIATCMDFFYVEESDDEAETNQTASNALPGFTGVGEFLHEPPVYFNNGAADDLGEDDRSMSRFLVDGADAGMSLEFCGNEQLAGRKKQWEHDGHEFPNKHRG
ncbi:LAQU0S01e01926g1_1 [Lachancea quebecensis]|uniref:Protein LOT5 n=1 Tax=Lachancea quebecensis TaxID=1654605 RepID=A0A0P1KK74_9SACH|nr:LAQU0S01e01926g1_1 [Lachancea quebecensis]